MNVTVEEIDYDAPQMNRAMNKLRRTSAMFAIECERVHQEAEAIRRRDATPIPRMWPWDEPTPQDQPKGNE